MRLMGGLGELILIDFDLTELVIVQIIRHPAFRISPTITSNLVLKLHQIWCYKFFVNLQ